MALQPNFRTALTSICTSPTLTMPSPLKSFAGAAVPKASLSMRCTSATLGAESPVGWHKPPPGMVKFPVIEAGAFMVTEVGLVLPVAAPLHELKVAGGVAVAVTVTLDPES